jgi:hypothetical protein
VPTTWESYLASENRRFVRSKCASIAFQLLTVLSLIAYDKAVGLPRVKLSRYSHRYAASARSGGLRRITRTFEL